MKKKKLVTTVKSFECDLEWASGNTNSIEKLFRGENFPRIRRITGFLWSDHQLFFHDLKKNNYFLAKQIWSGCKNHNRSGNQKPAYIK